MSDTLLERAIEEAREALNEDDSIEDAFKALASEGLDKIALRAPLFESATRDELKKLLGLATQADPDDLEELAYNERRAMFKRTTQEGLRAARARAERLTALADLVEELGAIALKVLPILVTAL